MNVLAIATTSPHVPAAQGGGLDVVVAVVLGGVAGLLAGAVLTLIAIRRFGSRGDAGGSDGGEAPRRASVTPHAIDSPLPLEPSIASAPGASASAGLAPAARRLIDIRDHVVGPDASGDPARTRAWLYSRLGTVLAELGVETIDTTGPVDWNVHEAVGTTPATDAALRETIASTVRPGYRFNGVVIRPQQVMLYVAGP